MTVAFTCHPVERMRIGRFEFVKASLKLESDADVEEFRTLLDAQPGFIKQKVRELSVEAANAVAAKFMSGRKITGIDTTRNSMGAPQPQQNGEPTDPVAEPSDSESEDGEAGEEGSEEGGADTNVNDAAAAATPLRFGTRTAE